MKSFLSRKLNFEFISSRVRICKINFKDYKFLRKFITEQGKIIPGFVTGVSAKYQRMLTKEIKKARNIALLPYVHDPRN